MPYPIEKEIYRFVYNIASSVEISENGTTTIEMI